MRARRKYWGRWWVWLCASAKASVLPRQGNNRILDQAQVGRKKAVVVDRSFQNKGFRAQRLRAERLFHGILKLLVDFPHWRVGKLRRRFRVGGADCLLRLAFTKNAA